MLKEHSELGAEPDHGWPVLGPHGGLQRIPPNHTVIKNHSHPHLPVLSRAWLTFDSTVVRKKE